MAFGKLEGLFTYLYLLDDHTRIVLLFSRTSYLGTIRSRGYCVLVVFLLLVYTFTAPCYFHSFLAIGLDWIRVG